VQAGDRVIDVSAGAPRRDPVRITRARIGLLILGFTLVFGVIAGRLVQLAAQAESHVAKRLPASEATAASRPDIFDRNGRLIATDVRAPSLFGEPRKILDVDEAADQLAAILPDADKREMRERLASKRGFVWLKREISPAQRAAIHRLGLPGISFLPESRRVYPAGSELAHALGYVSVDNVGIAGLEKWVDGQGLAELRMAGLTTDRTLAPVSLALDLAVQHAVRDELLAAIARYKANAAAGLVLDVRTGEIVSMASLPDFDPNQPRGTRDVMRLNRLTTGVYEMGSTFKALTVALALDSGKFTLGSQLDAREPLRHGKYTINDFHAQRRILSLPEVFTYSSNVGAARMALAMGVDAHRAFLKKMGQLDRLRTELPESAEPLMPKRWSELNTATIAFGHGLSVAPLQAVMATAALVNGGYLIPPTFLRRSEEEAKKLAVRVIKPETSEKMRYLFRLNVEKGSARRAEVEGYYVGGKTGTSEKVVGGRYMKNKRLTVFMGVFPADAPRYLVLVMLDEPQAAPDQREATSGLNAAPTSARIIARIGPLLGVQPRLDAPPAERLLVRAGR
jgi:cell division protein FtsI (penicillin-binding protein 3)